MSETQDRQDGGVEFETATMEDVQRTLRELRGETQTLREQLNRERSTRASLETDLGQERNARSAAEATASEHAAKFVSEAERRWIAEKSAAEAAITAREQALSAAEDDYARHAEMGEWKEAAKAQTALAKLTGEIQTHRQKIEFLDANKERIVPKAQERQEPRRQTPVPVARHRYAEFIDGDLVGGEEAFLDSRPQFRTDQSYRDQVFAASNIASRRHPRGSEPYLREVARILNEDVDSHEDHNGDFNRDDNRSSRRDANSGRDTGRNNDRDTGDRQGNKFQSADLPPSRRSGPGQNPQGSREVVRLSPQQRDIADGLYGNPNAEFYIADPTERYTHYYTNLKRMEARG